jgi:hypothetical protein
LFAGAGANSVSARSPNFRVAAAACGFLTFETVAAAGFDWSGSAAIKKSLAKIPHANITVSAKRTGTVPPAGKLRSGKV